MHKSKQAIQIFTILSQANPSPKTELVYASDFELLIAVVLSAQATDVSVNKATRELFIKANTPRSILDLGVSQLEYYIKSIGLYKTKAKNIVNLCKILIDKFDSQIPNTFTDLVALPGVGRKTANVILNTAFNHPVIAVDTHVFRVARRVGLATSNTLMGVETELTKLIAHEHIVNAHHHLILHGRYICKARKPLCHKCNIHAYCLYYNSSIKPEVNLNAK